MRARASTLLLLLLPVLGGLGGWWLLARPGSDDADRGPGTAAERGPHDARGPHLTGATREPAELHAQAARHPVRVRIADERGRPVAGVRVTARRLGEASVRGNGARGADGLDFVRRLAARPKERANEAPDAEAVSGPDGLLTLPLPDDARYEVRAEPDPPHFGEHADWPRGDGSPPHAPLELRVREGSAIVGRVVDARGRGLGARVWARTSSESDVWTSPHVATEPGSGRFTLPAVPPGPVGVGVLVPGRFRGVLAQVTAPHDSEVVLRLDDDAPLLTGFVRTTAGEPVEGAYVLVALGPAAQSGQPDAWAHFVELLARSDTAGAYEISGPFAGRVVRLMAAGPGTQVLAEEGTRARWFGLELAPGRTSTLDLTLHRGGVLAGRVRDLGSGAPLPGAQVRLEPRVGSPGVPQGEFLEAVADAQGRYAIEGIPVGLSVLTVEHPSHHLPAQAEARRVRGEVERRHADWRDLPPSDLLVFVPEDGRRVERDLGLVRGVPVRGRVLGPDGEAMAGASVSVHVHEGDAGRWGVRPSAHGDALATSDASGRFEIAGLPAGTGWRLIARRRPLVGAPSAPLTLVSGEPVEDLALRLERGRAVAGRVRDVSGAPVADARVSLWLHGESQHQDEQRTRSDGTFQFEGVPPDEGGVEAEAPQGRVWLPEAIPSGVAPSEPLELVLEAAEPELRVRATDAQGRPAAGARLYSESAAGDEAWTCDATGLARITGSGLIRVLAVRDGPILVEASAGPEEVRVVVPTQPTRALEIAVTDAQGAPIPYFTVFVSSDPPRFTSGSGFNAGLGLARVGLTSPGPHRIRVYGPRDAAGQPLNLRERSIDVVEPPTTPLEVRLEPGAEVAGTVVDEKGQGVAGVLVECEGISGRTDAAGGFVIGGLPDRSALLYVAPPMAYVAPGWMSVSPGARPLRVVLVRGGAVAGVVLAPDGRRMSYARVRADQAGSDASWTVFTSPDGAFRIDGLPPDAHVDVTARGHDDDREESGPAVTLPGVRVGTLDLRIALTRGARVTGQVLDDTGAPYGGGRVSVSHEDDDSSTSYSVLTDALGRFLVERLPPGVAVSLSAATRDWALHTAEVEVTSPASDVVLRLPRLHPIRGRIEGPREGAPWQVSARSAGPDDEDDEISVKAEADGLFVLDGAKPARVYVLRAYRAGDEHFAHVPDVRAGTSGVRLVLRRGRSIEGFVRDAAGNPLRDGQVSTHIGFSVDVSVRTDARGAYRLAGLPPGVYDLRVYRHGYGHAAREDVPDGSAGIDFALERDDD